MARVAKRLNPYWLGPSIAIAVPLILGPLGAWLGWLRPDTGFFLVGTGVLLAFLSSAALAATTAYASATGKPWRRSALRAALLPAAVALATLAFVRMRGTPTVNDISTDLEDRPRFSADSLAPAEAAGERAARLAFFAGQQREAYPDLGPLRLPVSAADAFERATAVARSMPHWEVVARDPVELQLEARATTRVFHFVDDVVVRVREENGAARIDVRSRSRLGRADFGANADRIRAFMRALRAADG